MCIPYKWSKDMNPEAYYKTADNGVKTTNRKAVYCCCCCCCTFMYFIFPCINVFMFKNYLYVYKKKKRYL